MIDRFGKSLGDVALETAKMIRENRERLARQMEAGQKVKELPTRMNCPVCNNDLKGAPRFSHRDLPFLLCPTCGQVVSAWQPLAQAGPGLFDQIYPRLEQTEFASRRDRIYTPKLEWVLEVLEAVGYDIPELLKRKWLELGSGYGFFLDALCRAGAGRILGLEADPDLVARSREVLGSDLVCPYDGSLAEAVKDNEAGIYAAWFVLEHIEDIGSFAQALKGKPRGTLFIFSVPVWGFSAALEGAFKDHFARSLDGSVHTQLFTDKSIAYFMDAAGLKPLARWTFGQDAADLGRLIRVRLPEQLPRDLREQLEEGYAAALDDIQAALDRSLISDSRHFISVRE